MLNKTAQQVIQGEELADSEMKDKSPPPLHSVTTMKDESWANVNYYQSQSESEAKHHQTSTGHRVDLTQEHHQMTAVLEEGSLRVSFSLLEEDM